MYVKLVNNQVNEFPYNLGDLKKENPNTSFPDSITAETLASFDVYKVTETPAPNFDNSVNYCVQSVVNVDGTWTQTWALQLLPEERAAANVRAKRDALLAASDWIGLTDCQLDATAKTAWVAYREDLRLVPQQFDFPWAVTWPVKPGDS